MFVLPSIIFSMVCIVPVLYGIIKSMNLETSYVPSAGSVVYALFLGLMIPGLSSIVPIRKALSMSVVNSLGSNRSHENANKGSVVTISSKLHPNLAPLVTMGILSVSFGCMLFYGMPYALGNFICNIDQSHSRIDVNCLQLAEYCRNRLHQASFTVVGKEKHGKPHKKESSFSQKEKLADIFDLCFSYRYHSFPSCYN
jgi:hypothetical protein